VGLKFAMGVSRLREGIALVRQESVHSKSSMHRGSTELNGVLYGRRLIFAEKDDAREARADHPHCRSLLASDQRAARQRTSRSADKTGVILNHAEAKLRGSNLYRMKSTEAWFSALQFAW
jgi:hypothetical protein